MKHERLDDLEWVIDICTFYHATPQRKFFTTYRPGNFGVVKMGNYGMADIISIDDIHIKTNLSCKLMLKDVRHMDEKMEKLEEQGQIELFKEKSQLSTYYCPSEVLKSPNEAMEFLSRTWSPSSSDFSQILWSNGGELDQGLQEQQTEESLVQFEEDDKTRLEQALTLLSTGNLVRSGKLKQLHFGWMNVGRMKAWLGVELFSSLSRGCREKRNEKVRVREARVHAALSVARLAAAIAGISANSRLEPTNAKSTSMTGMGGGALDEKMNAVVASAAALVATVCAEAAESVGANREGVASAISTGLATKTSADMVTLTATCLRGAATLELRPAAGRHASEDQKTLARGARLPVRMPKDTIFNAMEDLKEGGISKDDHGFYSITLGTTGGAIQIMFEQQVQYRIWRSTICHLLCDC
ncbi:unnamed protein product [Musa acuminata subsp. malaccensis]|uniref:(wild Malaysian banana) hypothetical protein n=1 Tax=Musa acuminata subsp. malaccensis TaxID=214687 RepID=A0A8D6ZZ17_MUSAM|nr:unnamed protein product [Musa acuminata subsp. malaccensis]